MSTDAQFLFSTSEMFKSINIKAIVKFTFI